MAEACRIEQQIFYSHLPATCASFRKVGCIGIYKDPGVSETGNKFRDRILQIHLALLNQLHRGHRRDRLTHRADLEDRVLQHRVFLLDVIPAHAFQIDDLTMASYPRDETRDAPIFHMLQ